jgi:hypothetical protein
MPGLLFAVDGLLTTVVGLHTTVVKGKNPAKNFQQT